MNEHTVPNRADGYLFEFRGTRTLRESARWLTGLGLVIGGVTIAVLGNASSSFLSLPLGIALTVLGTILLVSYARDRKTMSRAAPAKAGKHRIRSLRRVSSKESLAAELALLANLHSQGALTQGEFQAAKRRLLDN